MFSGVAPANQTKESEVRELLGIESGIGSGTLFSMVNTMQYPPKRGFRNQFQTPSPKVREPHFPWFGLPELLVSFALLRCPYQLNVFGRCQHVCMGATSSANNNTHTHTHPRARERERDREREREREKKKKKRLSSKTVHREWSVMCLLVYWSFRPYVVTPFGEVVWGLWWVWGLKIAGKALKG